MEGPEITAAVATIDNGSFGTRTIRFETGRLAKQADGAVVAYLDDDTMIMSTTTAGRTPKDQFDFFPLTVDVEERMYSIGKIPGSFFRREGRPSTEAILTCRLIDRPLRPSFVKGLRNEVQIVITVYSLNPEHQYDVLAINAASASTQISGLPFSGPIGGVRVSRIDGHWVAFPNFSDAERSTFDMVVAGRIVGDDVAIMMVEAEATDATWDLVKHQGQQAPTEEVVAEGLEAAKKFIRVLCEAQADLASRAAKETIEFPRFLDYQDDVYAVVEAEIADDALTRKRYMHHYNFPPFSNGETGFMRGPKRREIGHGAARRARLLPGRARPGRVPLHDPLVSEVLASNGSTVDGVGLWLDPVADGRRCADQGAVAGIAMGLVYADGKYTTLTDILGAEDAFGDMDFKVAGTAEFVTALQLDTKIDGIPADVLAAALEQAKEARLAILEVMNACHRRARVRGGRTLPKIISFEIPIDKIGEVIGPKGKVINAIQAETGADISVDDDGSITLAPS
jgi:polyribonucleotide nucleotidyltransferase